ncbi:MAG: 30S ribosomal protein S6 [Fimbriimonadales bacterium]|jgi:small subunit ribosomal protein S6|nr:30S ribosomal protein S6 [Armatimonadota bacterium]MCX7687472.1 30S ribosomal protein S6 [Fimbriimonadales bacterium]CUU10201.1 small subunit ribosomal protein S6 [Armatimonadetes bacterium GBS]CUU35072.1 small subunit ribosomal protein S6 [Armatimonadetes bacterium GXS]CUU37137.1 small subunit ribosomal protein S6 [Armatimonadetes bacterium DC]
MEQTRYYETMVIVPTTLGEEQVNALIERARTVLQNLGATVDEARVWDQRKLAYEIKHHKEGIYLLFRYHGAPQAAEELNRILKINEDVIRFRTFRLEPEEVAQV